ncbi:hypothetical protein VE04_09984, partial [Pseudogymnoascus sp. 24MN13]
MHQQPGDRSCANEAIGGDHFGPVMGYLSKVENAATADGSAGWFKIYEDSWARVCFSLANCQLLPSGHSITDGTGSNGAADYWGTKDMNLCCGRVNMKIPADIHAGDSLLRAEVVALHVAGSLGGAQLYMSCYQLTISGGGSASPSLIQLPGAYAATDPGIKVDIYQSLATYIAPGPTVYGGFTKSAAPPRSRRPARPPSPRTKVVVGRRRLRMLVLDLLLLFLRPRRDDDGDECCSYDWGCVIDEYGGARWVQEPE